MKRLLERSRYLAAMASLVSGVLALTLFVWSGVKAIDFVAGLVRGDWRESSQIAELLSALDITLTGTVLLIITLGLWELFVEDLDLPEWLTITDLSQLKDRVIDVVVLVVAIRLVESYFRNTPADVLLEQAAAVALLIASLTAYTWARHR
jgi:uncharacterized membrane protein YqhA